MVKISQLPAIVTVDPSDLLAAVDTSTSATGQTTINDAVRAVIHEERIDVTNYGVSGDGVTDNTAALTALVAMNKELVFPPTAASYKTDVVDLTGSRSVLVGVNEQSVISQNAAVVGPLVDATNWEGVGNNFGWRAHRHLRLEGNGVDNAANVGLNIDGSNNGHWQNISIKGTGAQAIYCTGSNWQRFTDVVVGRPVNTSYPYIQVHRVANNYLWENVGLRSEDATTDPVACVKYTNETGYVATGHQWTGTWLENLHMAEGSAVFDVTARSCLFGFPWVFDCEAVATTSTDTTIFLIRDLLGDEGGTNPWAGGNHIVGQINGQIQDTGKSAEFHENRIAFGVKINESGTRVSGLRGFQGNNVYLAAGVEDCWIELGGAEYDQDDAVAGVVDSSGNSTNTIIDPLGVGIQWGSAAKQGFYGTTPVAQQTGVAVSAAGVHAALVNLGLITA